MFKSDQLSTLMLQYLFLLYRSTVLCYSENEAKIYSAYTLFLCWWWTCVWKVSFELYTICSSDVRLPYIGDFKVYIGNLLKFHPLRKRNMNAFKRTQKLTGKWIIAHPPPPKPHLQNLMMLFCNLIWVNSVSTIL